MSLPLPFRAQDADAPSSASTGESEGVPVSSTVLSDGSFLTAHEFVAREPHPAPSQSPEASPAAIELATRDGSDSHKERRPLRRRRSSGHAQITSIVIHSPVAVDPSPAAPSMPSPLPSPSLPSPAASPPPPPESNRVVFELTELDMLRLRPFVHGVHRRVTKKRTRWTFGPDSRCRRVWCCLRALATVYFLLFIPLRACATLRTDEFPITLIVDYVLDLFFLLDFLACNFVFSVYADSSIDSGERQLVYRPREISRLYRSRPGFRYDVLAILPVDYIFLGLRWWRVVLWVRLLKLVRLPNLPSTVRSIRPQLIRNQLDPIMRRIGVVLAATYLAIHWAACGWNMLRYGAAYNQSDDPDYADIASQYVESLYFIQTTVVTLGYGDIAPETTPEVIFVTGIMVLGFVAQSYLVGHLVTLLTHRLEKRATHRSALLRLKQYCTTNDLSPAVTRRLFHYWHYMWARQEGRDDRQMMRDLPTIYLHEFGIEMTLDILAKIPFMCQDGAVNAPAGFVRALIPYLEPETFCPNVTILQQGACNTRLFIVLHGRAEQILDDVDEGIVVESTLPLPKQASSPGVGESPIASPSSPACRSKSLPAGSYFGHDSFLVPFHSLPCTVLSTTYVDVLSIRADHFRHCLACYPEFESSVLQYVERVYAADDAFRASARTLTLNANVSARLRRIRRELHMNRLKALFAQRQRSRRHQDANRHSKRALATANKPGGTHRRLTHAATHRTRHVAAAATNVLKPHSILHIALQSLSFILFAYMLVSLPLRIAYASSWVSSSEFIDALLADYLIDAFFWVEFVLRLSTIAILDPLSPHDPIITDRRQIWTTYVGSRAFWMDLASLLPFDLLPLFLSFRASHENQIQLTYVCLVRLRILLRLHRFFEYFQSAAFAVMLLSGTSTGALQLNEQTGGFGGASQEATNRIDTGATDGRNETEDTSSGEDSEEEHQSEAAATTTATPTGDAAVVAPSTSASLFSKLNTPNPSLPHVYHSRTSLLVLRTLLVITLFIHFSSCFFFYVARVEGVPDGAINADGSSNDDASSSDLSSDDCSGATCGKTTYYSADQSYNWAWRAHVWSNEAPTSVQYLQSLLWALETCTVIGFGSIAPITTAERVYTFFFTFIGSTLYLLLLGFLTVLVDSAFLNAHTFEQSVARADYFLQRQNLTTTLRLRVHTWYHYLCFIQNGERDDEFLAHLPTHLRLDVVSFLTLPIVTALPATVNIDLGALERVLLALTPISAVPMDVLMMQGDVSDQVIMIQKGVVEVTRHATTDGGPDERNDDVDEPERPAPDHPSGSPQPPRATITLPSLRSGDYFNDRCLLVLSPSPANYVALSFCQLFTLAKRSFDDAIAPYPHFVSVVRARRERANHQEKEKCERLRRQVEQMEQEHLVAISPPPTTTPTPISPVPPPPPPSPPPMPAPTSTAASSPPAAAVVSSSFAHVRLPPLIPETPDRVQAKLLKKARMQEKMQRLREEKQEKRLERGVTRRVSRRRSLTGDAKIAQSMLSDAAAARSPPIQSPYSARRQLHEIEKPVMPDQGLVDSDDEETRLKLMTLRRRNTRLRLIRAGTIPTLDRTSEELASPTSAPHRLTVDVTMAEQNLDDFGELERDITRRLHGGSVRDFLSAAERDANEAVMSPGTPNANEPGSESNHLEPASGASVTNQADAAVLKQQQEEMSAALLALASDPAPMQPNTRQDSPAKSPTSLASGGWASSARVGDSFAPLPIKRAQTPAPASVLEKSFVARALYSFVSSASSLVRCCFCRAPRSAPPRVFAPTSTVRLVWNLISISIIFYDLIVVPLRICIGLFPTDSVLGTRGMDDNGNIAHTVPADISLTGVAHEFVGLRLWYGTYDHRTAVKVLLWVVDLLITFFWTVDIALRCLNFPLFVHHADGVTAMAEATITSATPRDGLDAQSVRHALHDASGRSSPDLLLVAGGGGARFSLANTVLLVKQTFLNDQHAPNTRKDPVHITPRAHNEFAEHGRIGERPAPKHQDDLADIGPSVPCHPPTAAPPPPPHLSAIFDAYYSSGHLKWDLLATLPFDLVFGLWYPEVASLVRLARLLRVHRLIEYVRSIENWIEFRAVRINAAVMRILEQCIVLLVALHIFGCAWFLIGRISFVYFGIASTSDNAAVYSTILGRVVEHPMQVSMPSQFDDTHSWTSEEAFTPLYGNERTISNLYLYSIYFVLTCISTTGFGDIVPHTTVESIFSVVLIIFGCIIFSFVTANIASLASNLDASAEVFGEKLDVVKQFLATHTHALPADLQARIRTYFREQWIASKGNEEAHLLEEVPHFLRQSLVYTMHHTMLQRHPLFRGLEDHFLLQLSLALRHMLVTASQVVLRAGDVSLDVYFIRTGSLQVVRDDGIVVDQLSEGGSFNEGALMRIEDLRRDEDKRAKRASKKMNRKSVESGDVTAGAGNSAPDTLPVDSAAPSATPLLVPTPTIRQLYSIVAVSRSVELHTLHQQSVAALCRRYPVSAAELRRRWAEKTALALPDTRPDEDGGKAQDQQPAASDPNDHLLDDVESDSAEEDEDAPPSPAPAIVGGAPRYPSMYLTPSAADTSSTAHVGHDVHVHHHSHAIPTSGASPRQARRRLARSKPVMARMSTFTTDGILKMMNEHTATSTHARRPSTMKHVGSDEDSDSSSLCREGSMERLRWDLVSLAALAVDCWVVPLFIAFVQVRILHTSTDGTEEMRALDSHTVYWVFIALIFASDAFFLADFYRRIRHFACERHLEEVHWRHYFSDEQMKARLNEAIEERSSEQQADATITVKTEEVNGMTTDALLSAPSSSPPALTSPPAAVPTFYTSLSSLPFTTPAFPTSSSEIAYAYFHQPYAWWKVSCDLIAVLPVSAVALIVMAGIDSSDINFTLLALLGLTRAFLLLRVPSYLSSMDAYLDRTETVIVSFQSRRILKFGLLILYIVHWVSCIWLMIGSTRRTTQDVDADIALGIPTHSPVTWMMLMKSGRILSLSAWHQYLYSVYWSVTVVTTTGLGDITPTNPGEVAFCMAVMVVGNVIYGCLIGAITSATANAAASSTKHFDAMHALRHWLSHRHASTSLTDKVVAYRKHMWRAHTTIDEESPLHALPMLLRREVCFALYGRYLTQVPFFPVHDASFLSHLSLLLRPQTFLAGDLLMRKNDIASEMHFLHSGRVRVFIYDSEEAGGSLRKKITLQACLWLGETSFFSRSLRSASVRALTHCDVLVLANDELHALLEQYPTYRRTIYERFLQHAEQNYDEQKKPIQNATFLDLDAMVRDNAEPRTKQNVQPHQHAQQEDEQLDQYDDHPSALSEAASDRDHGLEPPGVSSVSSRRSHSHSRHIHMTTGGGGRRRRVYTITPRMSITQMSDLARHQAMRSVDASRRATGASDDVLPTDLPRAADLTPATSSSSSGPIAPLASFTPATPAVPATVAVGTASAAPPSSSSSISFANLVKLIGPTSVLPSSLSIAAADPNSMQQLGRHAMQRQDTLARMINS